MRSKQKVTQLKGVSNKQAPKKNIGNTMEQKLQQLAIDKLGLQFQIQSLQGEIKGLKSTIDTLLNKFNNSKAE